MLLLSLLAHHSEPGDPVLLGWIKHQIDSLVGLGPAAIVTALAIVILSIPVAIMLAYFFQRTRQSRS